MDMCCYTASSWKLSSASYLDRATIPPPLSLSVSLPLSVSRTGWLGSVPCETVIGCTPCSRANPGAVGKYFLSWRIDFLRQHAGRRDRPRAYTRKFIPATRRASSCGTSDKSSSSSSSLQSPPPRRLINSDRRSFRPACFFFFFFIGNGEGRGWIVEGIFWNGAG